MIDLFLRCVPPETTAQQKRVRFVGRRRPVFFQPERLQREERGWAALLQPHQPEAPLEGPLELRLRLVWPHVKGVRKADATRLLPKTTKPDSVNVVKHLEDLLVRMRFVVDDALICRHVLERFRGPEHEVGIRIVIAPFREE